VDQPSVAATISILRGLRERYEVHHGVRISDSALVEAAVQSDRCGGARGGGGRGDGAGGAAVHTARTRP
jgi:hypothetical protein